MRPPGMRPIIPGLAHDRALPLHRDGGLVPPAPIDVLLVSLPFGMLESPSLALGILQARLGAAGIGSRTRHFTLDHAARIGAEAYRRIAAGFPRTTDLLGEWIFSHAVRPKSPDRS